MMGPARPLKKEKRVMDLEKMINWDLVDKKFNYAAIDAVSISFHATNQFVVEPCKIIERPRVFEDGAFYPVVLKGVDMNDTARYSHPGFFYITSSDCSFEKNEFSFIGEKLPDSLWGDQS